MKSLLLTLLILTVTSVDAAWHSYKGVTVWANYSNKDRSFSWTGTTDSDGKAHGDGVFTLYFKGEKIATYTGTMRQGRMDGHVKAIYHKDKLRRTYEGELRDWSEDGFGTLILADGTKQTGRWQKGMLVAAVTDDGSQPSEPPAQALKSGQTVTTPSPADNAPGILALAADITPPGEKASPAEKFLYGLAAVTESFFLDAAYKPGYGNDVLTDALWSLHRATEVKALTQSPLGAQIPATLRDFCNEALILDAMLQATSRASESAISEGKDDARDLFIDSVQHLPRQFDEDADDTIERNVAGMIFKSILRGKTVERMLESLVRQKKVGDYHRKWSALLGRLAAEDTALRPYAQDPRITDPTWHFMRSSVAGDVFFGQSYSTRAREHYAIDRMPHRKANAGNLADGPIEIKVSGRGALVYDVSFIAPGGSGPPIIVGRCSRGHFALRAVDETTWVARGLSDSPRQGKIDFSRYPYWRGGNALVTLMHFATTGKGEDSETNGDIVIYTRSQAASAEEARQIARRVSL